MSTGYEIIFQRRYGGHDGNTEWEYFTSIPALTEFFRDWLSNHGPSQVIKAVHFPKEHSTFFCLPQGMPHHIAGRLVSAWAALDMESFCFIIRMGESYFQQIGRP